MKIALAVRRREGGDPGQVWVVPAAGGAFQQALDLGKEKGAGDPSWSLDSRMIAVQPHNGDKELSIIRENRK